MTLEEFRKLVMCTAVLLFIAVGGSRSSFAEKMEPMRTFATLLMETKPSMAFSTCGMQALRCQISARSIVPLLGAGSGHRGGNKLGEKKIALERRQDSPGANKIALERKPGRIKDGLIWVDCEMTGLGDEGGPGGDSLLEVACFITDADLNVIAEGPDLVIHQPDEVLENMNDWCKKQFGWIGGEAAPGKLAAEVQSSNITVEEADRQLTAFAKKYLEKGYGILAGNTVHMDKRFLDKYTPNFMEHLHYRIVDVSTLREVARRWFPRELKRLPQKRSAHRAMDDIRGSLDELRYFRQSLFKPGPRVAR